MFALPVHVLLSKPHQTQPFFIVVSRLSVSCSQRRFEASHSQRQVRGMQIKARFAQKARKPSLVFLNQGKKNWLQSTNLTRGFLESLPKNLCFIVFPGAVRWGAFCPGWGLNFRWEFSQHLPPYQYIKVCLVAPYPSLCLWSDDLHTRPSSHLSNFSRIF